MGFRPSTGVLWKWSSCRMSEGATDEQPAKLLKRANEENDVQPTKRIKAEEDPAEDDRRFPKKKVVLLLAYSGKGYYGMQVRVVRSALETSCCCHANVLSCVPEKCRKLSV